MNLLQVVQLMAILGNEGSCEEIPAERLPMRIRSVPVDIPHGKRGNWDKAVTHRAKKLAARKRERQARNKQARKGR
jgi:hypothetical protein